ncbi:hypothetical protein [Bacillus altitudinis]|uniref:hypothetical protein n=1 Tax=Bacillus altitudinis TaxID=293387 RepID=UPI0033160CFA
MKKITKVTIWDEKIFNMLILSKLEIFKEYAKLIEDKIYQESNLEISFLNTLNDKNKYLNDNLDNFYNLQVAYPNLLRQSLLVSIISFLEAELISLYRVDNEILVNFRGNMLQKISNYAKAKHGTFPNSKSYWNYIQNVYELRNCIVHNAGFINMYKEPKELSIIIERLKHVKGTSTIKLEKGFLFEFINEVRKFLLDVRLEHSNKSPQS